MSWSTKPLAGVFAATLVVFLASGAVLPILPRYVHGPLGAGDLTVGLVVGAFSLTAIVSRPWSGRLADRHGRRVVFMLGALVMSAGGALMYVPAGVPGAVGARLVYGVGQGAMFTAGSAWAVDLAPYRRRGRVIAWYGLSVWAGLSLGPVLGGVLGSVLGYDAVWAATAVLPALGAAIVWRLASDRPRGPKPGGAQPRLIVREALASGAALALANVGYGVFTAFVGLLLVSQGIAHSAAMFPAFAAAVVGARVLLGSLPDRFGALRIGVAAATLEALGLAIIASAQSWAMALVGATVMGAAFAVLYPALALSVMDRVDRRRRGAALGTFTACFDAGFGLGAPMAGVVAALAGYAAAFWVAAACSIAAALIAARLERADRRRVTFDGLSVGPPPFRV